MNTTTTTSGNYAIPSSLSYDELYTTIIQILTGTWYLSNECQALFMAIQGSISVRTMLYNTNTNGKQNTVYWFHSFILSVIAGYGGGLLGFIWMGKPSSLLSNDINIGSCIIGWLLINKIPYGYTICTSLPFVLVTTIFAQLFRSTSIIKFINVCYNEFKLSPSPYYPIPIFGPILYGTLLGNMSGFIVKGFNHISNGMPWPFQNGLFVGTMYHFYVNDQDGPIGITLRTLLPIDLFISKSSILYLDIHTFATCCVSIFMIIIGILQLPYFFGPSFTPFDMSTYLSFFTNYNDNTSTTTTISQKEQNVVPTITAPNGKRTTTKSVKIIEPMSEETTASMNDNNGTNDSTTKKNKKKKKKTN